MSSDLDPKQSLIVRVILLCLGLMFLVVTVVAAIRLNWIGLVTLGAAAYALWSWWQAHRASRGPSWPANVPRLYPELDGVRLCEFISTEQFERIRRFPIVTILPFTSEEASEEDTGLGRGLQLLLIRDLMLVPNISVHGSEDTPAVFLEAARELAEDDRTLYCLKQNPQMAAWIEAGEYDPAEENRQRIAELREKCQRL